MHMLVFAVTHLSAYHRGIRCRNYSAWRGKSRLHQSSGVTSRIQLKPNFKSLGAKPRGQQVPLSESIVNREMIVVVPPIVFEPFCVLSMKLQINL